MIQRESELQVADNTGAKIIKVINIPGNSRIGYAHLGDTIRAVVREALPDGTVKEKEIVTAVIVRSRSDIKRDTGEILRFNQNAAVIIDDELNEPIGTRIFGPIARELREKNYQKIISLAPDVI